MVGLQETRCKKQETCLPTGRLDSVLLLNKFCLKSRVVLLLVSRLSALASFLCRTLATEA